MTNCRGLGRILKFPIRNSSSIPLLQRGKRISCSIPTTSASFFRKPEARFVGAEANNKMATGLRRYDKTGEAEGK